MSNMKNKGCSDCEHKSEQGKLYVDKDTGLICAQLCDKYDKPDALVVVPFICTTCGTTNWKTVDNRKNN